MNRIGVVTSLLSAVPASYNAGELALIDTLGGIVDATHVGPYAPPCKIGVFLGTVGGEREIGYINPNRFTFETFAYRTAVGKTIKIGYNASPAGVFNTIDVTLAANIGKFGTLTLWNHDRTRSTNPAMGDTFQQTVQIASGETATTYLAKLNKAADKVAADVNAKYGAGTVTVTKSGSDATTLVQFAFAVGFNFTATLDGTFDGTTVQTTTQSVFSGQTGSEIRDKEKEAAILDGYNPTQTDKYVTFPLDQYLSAAVGTNYDGLVIHTVSDKQYQSPGHPEGWDITIELFGPNTTPGTVGAPISSIVALLTKIKQNVSLTKADADILYAAHA